jgi:hypothetical protein
MARQTLVTALEAWKAGKAASLASADPPIRFVDDDLSTGWQLMDYRLHQPEQTIQAFQTVFVDLTLRDRQGRRVNQTVGYQIAVYPRLVVLRADS